MKLKVFIMVLVLLLALNKDKPVTFRCFRVGCVPTIILCHIVTQDIGGGIMAKTQQCFVQQLRCTEIASEIYITQEVKSIMTKYIFSFFSFTLILFLLCSCSNQMPSIESEVKLTTSPVVSSTADILPTAEIPAPESEQQADMPESTDIVIPEDAAYDVIVDYYRSFMHRNETTDIEIEIQNLYDNIALEINLNDEQKEYELWCSCVDTRNSKLGYAIHDINYDGVPELLILSEGYYIHTIYSLQDGVPILVGGYWNRYSCAVDKAGLLYTDASSGAADNYYASYSLTSDNELQLVEMIGVESYDEQAGESLPEPRYYWIQNGNKTIIDYEEAQIIMGNFKDVYLNNPTENIGLIIVPLSD